MIQRTTPPVQRLGTLAFLVAGLFVSAACTQAQETATSAANPSAAAHDGQHDFDFEVGKWKIHLKRMLHPLSGSAEWVEFDGTSVTRQMWDGRANIEEFDTSSADGHVGGLTLRLYDPNARQWSLYWASQKSGQMSLPATVGEFKDGIGEFYDQEPFNGRQILVRYQWSRITPNSAHFEQAFSTDAGKTWEVNWITDQTRVKE
jgi:hypothetical protein